MKIAKTPVSELLTASDGGVKTVPAVSNKALRTIETTSALITIPTAPTFIPGLSAVEQTSPIAVADGGTKTLRDAAHTVVDRVIAVPQIGKEGFETKIDIVDAEKLPTQKFETAPGQHTTLADTPLALALMREVFIHEEKGRSMLSRPMIAAEDYALIGIERSAKEIASSGVQQGEVALIASASQLLDERLIYNPGAISKLFEVTGDLLHFMDPHGKDFGAIATAFGESTVGGFQKIARRFVSSDLKELKGVKTAIFLLDEADREILGLTREDLLKPISLGGIERVFVVPVNAPTKNAPVDALRAIHLGARLATQASRLDDIGTLDATTKLLLAEVAKGFVDGDALLATVQSEMLDAENFATSVLQGM